MEQRVNIESTWPEAWKAMYTLSASLSKVSLSTIEKELIKNRASQLNGCAFCSDMHTREALKAGETKQRLFVLHAWRDTDLFSDREKALLMLTEEVTLLPTGVSDETYRRAEQFFDDHKMAEIIMTIALINAWNRIAVSTHLTFAVTNS